MSDEHNSDPSHSDLSQVRDLLFGSQVRAIETKFEARINSLESSIREEMNSIRQTMDSRLSELDNSVREYIAAVDERLCSDNRAIGESLKGVAHQLTGDFAEKSHQFTTRLDSAEETLREYAVEQARNVWEELKTQNDLTIRRVDSELESIRSSTADKNSLGSMFQEIASRLSGNENAENQVAVSADQE